MMLSNLREEVGDGGVGDPFHRMLRREEGGRLFACWWLLLRVCQGGIDKTSFMEKEVLRLHECEGFRYSELSSRLGLSSSEVAALVRKSRRKVARYLHTVLNPGVL